MSERVDTTERILDAFLAPEADRLPDRVVHAALHEVARTPQRRALRAPWRTHHMLGLPRAAWLTTLSLLAVAGVGGLILANRHAPPTTPSPGPSASPIMTTDRPRSETVGWTPFVSAAYGYSAAVPPDWRVTFGIEPNTVDRFADGESLDAFTGQHGEGSIRAWSVGLSDGPSVDDWITTYLRQADPESACFPSRERWTSIVVGGHAGFVYPGCGSWREAMIPLDTRVYMVSTSVFDDHDPQASGPTADQQSEALLRAFLSTLAFQPEAAMPSSHETVLFTSPQYGYSVAVAAGWLTAAATTPWSAGERIGRGLPTVDTFRLSGTTPMQVYVAARPIAPGTTLDAWIASMAGTREELGGRCFYQTNGWEGTDANDQSLTVAGVEAKRRPMTCGRAAFGVEDWEQYAFVANGRGYAIAGTASMVRLVAGSFTLP